MRALATAAKARTAAATTRPSLRRGLTSRCRTEATEKGSLPYSVHGHALLFPVQLVEASALFLLFGVCLVVPFRRRWWAYLVGVSAIRLSFDFFRGDLPTCAGLSPQQFVAVGVLAALGVIGVRNR